MKKILQLFGLGVLLCTSAQAGHDNAPIGARAIGMGNASVTLRDSWSMFNNIGGLAGVKQKEVGVFVGNKFNNKSFKTIAAGFAAPLRDNKNGVIAVNVQRFGDDLLSQSRAGIGYGHQIAGVSLGIQVDYLQTSVSEIGSKGVFGIQFGGVAEITPELLVGAHIFNVTQAKIADYQNERLPTIMKAGLSYRPTKTLIINVETEKDIDYKARVKAGVEYEIVKKVYLRTGINTNNFSNFFGIGVKQSLFDFDYAATTHTKLGWSHAFSVSYKFLSRKNSVKPSNPAADL